MSTFAYTVKTTRKVHLETDDLNEARTYLGSKRCPGNAWIQYNEDAIEEINDDRSEIAQLTFNTVLPVYMNEDNDDRFLRHMSQKALREVARDYSFEIAPRSPRMPYLRRGMARTAVKSKLMEQLHKAQHETLKV